MRGAAGPETGRDSANERLRDPEGLRETARVAHVPTRGQVCVSVQLEASTQRTRPAALRLPDSAPAEQRRQFGEQCRSLAVVELPVRRATFGLLQAEEIITVTSIPLRQKIERDPRLQVSTASRVHYSVDVTSLSRPSQAGVLRAANYTD